MDASSVTGEKLVSEKGEETLAKVAAALSKLHEIKTAQYQKVSENVNAIIPVVRLLREAIAPEISELFDHLIGQRIEAIEDKHAIITQVNALLNEAGMSLKCPKTGKPGKLGLAGGRNTGTFQFVERGAPGAPLSSSVTFPKIELVPTEYEPRIHSRRRWGTSPEDQSPSR